MSRLPGLRRALVVGLGVTGAAVAEALLDEGLEVRVSDLGSGAGLDARAASLRARGADVRLGGHDLSWGRWADVIVPSKGVPPSDPLLAAALRRGAVVWSEFELAWRLRPTSVLAVTGTNGKTTTTMLLTEMLIDAGFDAVAAGNLPEPLVEATKRVAPDASSPILVCEASSFGLAFIDTFHPEVAVVLNVADAHYDWHEGYEDYLAAKARITENQDSDDLLVFGAFELGCVEIARRSKAGLAAFAGSSPSEVRDRAGDAVGRPVDAVAGVQDGWVVMQRAGGIERVLPAKDIRLPGVHNLENVLAASLAAQFKGVEVNSIAAVARRFEGLPHRTSLVAEVAGVRYVDDSKSTNPQSTLRAMEGLERVVLIAGGRDRGVDLSPLGALRGRLAGVVVMGETAAILEQMFAGLPVERASDVEEATRLAASIAVTGDTVLLSPGCASIDQYSSYAERGERFAREVRRL